MPFPLVGDDGWAEQVVAKPDGTSKNMSKKTQTSQESQGWCPVANEVKQGGKGRATATFHG